jgi:hypothetical protein
VWAKLEDLAAGALLASRALISRSEPVPVGGDCPRPGRPGQGGTIHSRSPRLSAACCRRGAGGKGPRRARQNPRRAPRNHTQTKPRSASRIKPGIPNERALVIAEHDLLTRVQIRYFGYFVRNNLENSYSTNVCTRRFSL